MKGANVQNLVYHPQKQVYDDYATLQKFLQKKYQCKHMSFDNIFGFGDTYPLITDAGIAGTFFVFYVVTYVLLHGVKSLFKLRVYE